MNESHSNPSQAALILAYMRENSITPYDALRMFGCFRLSARIHELRKAGHQVTVERYRTIGGKTVARYSLAER